MTITNISFRLATPNDTHLPHYDNTKLVAHNTCPMFGTVRYGLHKTMFEPGGRSIDLECGSAMHDVFAYVRLLTLLEQCYARHGDDFASAVRLHHGVRLFGHARWEIIEDNSGKADDDIVTWAIKGAISVLETSGFYDDPRNRRKTLSNMEEAAIAYIQRWRWDERIWMRDVDDVHSDIGVEIPFDLVVTVSHDEGLTLCSRRFTGKIDGIHHDKDGTIVLGENKTASRLNDAWSQSFQLNTQPTGYAIAASVFTGELVRQIDIFGLCIPLPKSHDYGGYLRERVRREDFHIRNWVHWFDATATAFERDMQSPTDALRFTHSCNRYFRACMFVPFCDSPPEEQKQMLEEMAMQEWSPLNEKAEIEA